MSTGTIENPSQEQVARQPTAAPTKPVRDAGASVTRKPGWIFNPVLDMLLVANICWPIFTWQLVSFAELPITKATGFVIAYFLIMPHRWITLSLVFFDRKRFKENSKPFLTVAGLIVVGVALTQLSLGAITLLLAIDLLWNGWHFAAQHGGIARIYDRMARPDSKSTGMMDKVVLRTLVLYALMRLAGTTMPEIGEGRLWLGWLPPTMAAMSVLDWPVMLLPLILVSREVIDRRPSAKGRVIYLLSLHALYATMIYAVRIDNFGLKIGCAASATVFHSLEYMAIVSWYVKKNKSLSETKPFSFLTPRWLVSITVFMACCLFSAYMLKERFLQSWIVINLVVSYMHYAYDGMIWKGPKKKAPAVAAA